MKINLELIQSKIETGKTRLHIEDEVKINFTSARLLHGPDDTFDSRAVYIGGWQDVRRHAGKAMPLNLICAAPKDGTIPSGIGSNILWVEDRTTVELFNAVQRIFDGYNRINAELLDAILNEEPLLSILDRCTRFFDNPVYVVDSAMKLVLYSSNLMDSELGTAWLDTLSSGFTSVKVINALQRANLLDKLNSATDPLLVDLDGITPPWLMANIFEDGKRIASVGVAALLNPVSRAHLGLLEHVTQLLTTFLRKSHNLNYVRSPHTERFLIDLLTGISLDKGILSHHLSQIGWKPNGDFFLLKILPTPKDLSGGTVEYSGKMVGRFFEASRMVILGEYLVVIANVTGYRQAELDRIFTRLHAFLRKRNFKCGVSLKFHCFTKLYDQYQLATSAVDIGSKIKSGACLFPYENYVIVHLIQSSEKAVDISMLCHPEISRLGEYDKENNAALLPTLYAYLMKERSLVAAAKRLNIHRNTLVYRINKICDIIDTDLDDDNNRLHLILSCEILRYLEKKYTGRHRDPESQSSVVSAQR